MVDDRGTLIPKIRQKLDWPSCKPGDRGSYWAIGDEEGLVLVLDKGLVWGLNTTTPKTFGVHPTVATIHGRGRRTYTVGDYPYELASR